MKSILARPRRPRARRQPRIEHVETFFQIDTGQPIRMACRCHEGVDHITRPGVAPAAPAGGPDARPRPIRR